MIGWQRKAAAAVAETSDRTPGVQENPFGYYLDFYVYPVVLVALPFLALREPGHPSAASWFAAAAIGLAVWTLVEYILHRYVLHNVFYFKGMHDSHHDEPKALIETPIYYSLAFLVIGVLAPAYWAVGPCKASGWAFGLTLGYVAFITMHHAMHFWRFPHDSYFYRAKHRHALHHYSNDEGNFGVTTQFWDYVFGTALPEPQLEKRQRDA